MDLPSRLKTCDGALSKEARKYANLDVGVSCVRWKVMGMVFEEWGDRVPSV